MAINYFINSNQFDVYDYELKFTPNDFHWKIDVYFKIGNNFQLPNNSLYVNFQFANQEIQRNYLNLDPTRSCLNFSNCKVYHASATVKLAADKYFSQKIDNQQIKGNINFGFSNEKLSKMDESQVKINNSIINKFENKVINSQQNFNFLFSNNYNLSYSNEENYYVNALVSWNIRKLNLNEYFNQKIYFNVSNYFSIKNTSIKRFFEIYSEPKKPFKIKNVVSYVDYYLNSNNRSQILKIENIDHLIKKRKENNYVIEYVGKSTFDENFLNLNNSGKIEGIFIPIFSSGKLKHKILLEINNSNFYVNLNNNFRFTKSYFFDEKSNLTTKIIDKKINLNFVAFEKYKFLCWSFLVELP